MKKSEQLNNKIKQTGTNKAADLATNIAKKLEDSTGLPVHVIDDSIPKEVFNALKKSEEFRKYLSKFSDDELQRELSDFWANFSLLSKPEDRNQESFLKNIAVFIEGLGKDTEYKAYIFIPGIYEFPKIKFGKDFKIVDYVSIKDEQYVAEQTARISENYSDISDDDIEKGLWIDFNFKTPHRVEVRKYLKEELQTYLGIISLMCFGFSIRLDLLIGVIIRGKRCYFIEPHYSNDGRIRNGWSRFPKDIGQSNENLERAAKIFGETKQSQIDKKLLLFAKLFLLSTQSESLEMKLVFTISALETLLLADYDQYYIGEKTAEKTSLILGKSFDERVRIYKFIKSQYSARSNFVHKGEANLKNQDIQQLGNISQRVFFEILILSEKYSQISGDGGLDNIFIKMKFSHQEK